MYVKALVADMKACKETPFCPSFEIARIQTREKVQSSAAGLAFFFSWKPLNCPVFW